MKIVSAIGRYVLMSCFELFRFPYVAALSYEVKRLLWIPLLQWALLFVRSAGKKNKSDWTKVKQGLYKKRGTLDEFLFLKCSFFFTTLLFFQFFFFF